MIKNLNADAKPLKLTIGRWLTDRDDEEAELVFEPFASIQSVTATLTWGPGSRQTRTYLIGEEGQDNLYSWLRHLYDDE